MYIALPTNATPLYATPLQVTWTLTVSSVTGPEVTTWTIADASVGLYWRNTSPVRAPVSVTIIYSDTLCCKLIYLSLPPSLPLPLSPSLLLSSSLPLSPSLFLPSFSLSPLLSPSPSLEPTMKLCFCFYTSNNTLLAQSDTLTVHNPTLSLRTPVTATQAQPIDITIKGMRRT